MIVAVICVTLSAKSNLQKRSPQAIYIRMYDQWQSSTDDPSLPGRLVDDIWGTIFVLETFVKLEYILNQ